MDYQSLINIFILSTLAGLATGIGGLLVMLKKLGEKTFSFSMGFSVGVMLVVAFLGLLKEAWEETGFLWATLGFAIGAFVMFGLDVVIPHIRFGVKEKSILEPKLLTTGMLIAIGVTLHNIPEGMAVGAGYSLLPKFGLLIALALALHNIPEGIAIALPICRSGASKWTAFKIAFFSGLVEPVGAIIAALFLVRFHFLIPFLLAFAGGVMVFITLDEILPNANQKEHQHSTAMGIVSGSILMFLLLGIFNI